MIRRIGEAVRPRQTYSHRPGAYAVLIRGSKILLTHQAEPTPEFQLPGGGIDRGESPIRALHREVYEETGWKIAVGRRLGAFRRFVYMPEYDRWAEKVAHVYLARPVLQLGPPTEPGHRAVWTSIELAHEVLANDGDRMFLARAV